MSQNQNWKPAALLPNSTNTVIQKMNTTTLATHPFRTPSLWKACTGKSYRNTPYWPHAQQHVTTEDCLLLSSHLVLFLLPWNGKIQDPLCPHILVNPPPIFRIFIDSLYYLWILPVSKYESVLNLTELVLSFWFQRYLVAASSIY